MMYRCMAVFVLCGVAGCVDVDYPALVHARSNAEVVRIKAQADVDPEVIRARAEVYRMKAPDVGGMSEFEAEQVRRGIAVTAMSLSCIVVGVCISCILVCLTAIVCVKLWCRFVGDPDRVPVPGAKGRAEDYHFS